MPILLFDGHCNLCNAWVDFIVKRDPTKKIQFASLQSKAGRRILEENGINTNFIDSLLFFEGNSYSKNSTAALNILSYLVGWERHLQFMALIPRPLRDLMYRLVAKYRYKLFGKRKECLIPSQGLNDRFLLD